MPFVIFRMLFEILRLCGVSHRYSDFSYLFEPLSVVIGVIVRIEVSAQYCFCVRCCLCRIFIPDYEGFIEEITDEFHYLLCIYQIGSRTGIVSAQVEDLCQVIHVSKHVSVLRREFV